MLFPSFPAQAFGGTLSLVACLMSVLALSFCLIQVPGFNTSIGWLSRLTPWFRSMMLSCLAVLFAQAYWASGSVLHAFLFSAAMVQSLCLVWIALLWFSPIFGAQDGHPPTTECAEWSLVLAGSLCVLSGGVNSALNLAQLSSPMLAGLGGLVAWVVYAFTRWLRVTSNAVVPVAFRAQLYGRLATRYFLAFECLCFALDNASGSMLTFCVLMLFCALHAFEIALVFPIVGGVFLGWAGIAPVSVCVALSVGGLAIAGVAMRRVPMWLQHAPQFALTALVYGLGINELVRRLGPGMASLVPAQESIVCVAVLLTSLSIAGLLQRIR